MRSSKALLSSRVIPANTPYHSCKYSTGTSRTIWYGYNCNCQFKESIQTYNIRLVCTVIRLLRYLQYCQRICNLESKNWRLLIRLVCTVIHYLQYLIPQPPVGLKVDRMSITIFKLIQYLCYTHRNLGRNLQYRLYTALLVKRVNSSSASM